MNDLVQKRANDPPSERQEAKKKPLLEGPSCIADSKVAEWLKRAYPSSRSGELLCRYVNAKAELVERFKAKIGVDEKFDSSKPSMSILLEFPTEDTKINDDLDYLAKSAGFRLLLAKKPANGNGNGNGETKSTYKIVENGASSDITKAAETMEKLLGLASEWSEQSKKATEWGYARRHKGMVWALGPPYSTVTIKP